MAVRSTMAALILRVRLLISDTQSPPMFFDQDIQDVMDEASRQDVFNLPLTPKVTFTGATIQYLTYEAPYGNWEGDYVLKQYLTGTVTASVAEVIPGIFTFATSTFPPVYLTGKTYDCYRAAADLLERWAAKWLLNHDFASDGQSFKSSQVPDMMDKRIKSLRMKQRAGVIVANRADLTGPGASGEPSLAPTAIDYMASG